MLSRNEDIDQNVSSTGARLIFSWNTQIERLKAGRLKRLRRLKTEQATAPRTDVFPRSVQQMFVVAGLRPRKSSTTHGGKGVGKKGGIVPPRLYLEERMRARQQKERKRREEEKRTSTVEDAWLEKRKRDLIRSSRRAAARVGLEAALSDRSRWTGVCNPPILVAEVEFICVGRWVLLPLWEDSSLADEVNNLVKPEQLSDAVASELENTVKNEMRSAILASNDRNGETAAGGRVVDGSSRAAVPKVVLRIN